MGQAKTIPTTPIGAVGDEPIDAKCHVNFLEKVVTGEKGRGGEV
jgi:hypothetical protein